MTPERAADATKRLIWGVRYLLRQQWLSDAQRGALDDVARMARLLLGDDWPQLADADTATIIGRLRAINGRGETAIFFDWSESARRVTQLIFDQRRADLDAEIARYQASTWPVLAGTFDELRNPETWARVIATATEAVGRTVGTAAGGIAKGLLGSPTGLILIAAAMLLLLSRR